MINEMKTQVWFAFSIFSILMGCKSQPTYDIVILNGTIVDGTGANPYRADLGVNADTIAFIGKLKESDGIKVIDARGRHISPGFIDIHTHCDNGLHVDETRGNLNFLSQGVTSVVTGNCGYRVFSLPKTKEVYDSLGGIGTNALPLIGFGNIRTRVLGRERRSPSGEELEQMKEELRKSLRYGAWGLSTGLQYVPQKYSTIEEVVEVSKVLGEFDALYTTHMRSEEEEIMSALDEALRIITEADIPLNISHLKANGRENWKYMDQLIEVVEAAHKKGRKITADMYPFDKSATVALYWMFHIPKELTSLHVAYREADQPGLEGEEKVRVRAAYVKELQKAFQDPLSREKIRELTEEGQVGYTNWVAKGGWNYFSIVDSPGKRVLENRMIIEVAEEEGRPPFEVAADLIVEQGADLIISLSTMLEENMIKQMKKDWVMFSSDGGGVSPDDTGVHPREYASASRVIRKYVREDKILSLADGIYKMTGFPAETLGLKDRGYVKEGQAADLVVFDYNNVFDNSTYVDPHQYSSGIDYVILNGKISIDQGAFNGTYNGRYLLKQYD